MLFHFCKLSYPHCLTCLIIFLYLSRFMISWLLFSSWMRES
uniref:Uncharacterized protein n=1 Tax=Arundo donax TaxID=35708 RepID=A0A0A9FEE4_ARUDO